MLAPIDKVKRRGGNDILQIVITRKCDIFNCSECTQLLPFRQDPIEMSLECIEEALSCVRHWPGVLAMFGGNPIMHSKFSQVCRLWEKYVPEQRKRGLWTNNLLKHGGLVKTVFWPHGRFNLNVHGNEEAKFEMQRWLPGIKVWGDNPSVHGGQLLDYRDYGISHLDWVTMRERCDINQKWSGAIYQRDDGHPYIYFCERAGALDGVRGTNNGLRVRPGCWSWDMDQFFQQVDNCCDGVCGVPLRTRGYLDSDTTYGVSPSLQQLTLIQKGKVKVDVLEEFPDTVPELTDYQRLRT